MSGDERQHPDLAFLCCDQERLQSPLDYIPKCSLNITCYRTYLCKLPGKRPDRRCGMTSKAVRDLFCHQVQVARSIASRLHLDPVSTKPLSIPSRHLRN